MKDGPLDGENPTSGQRVPPSGWPVPMWTDIAWVLKTFGEERFAEDYSRHRARSGDQPYVRTTASWRR